MKRRDVLKAAPGLVMIGTGFWAMLVPAAAYAAPHRFELRFLKQVGKGYEELDALPIPDAVAAEIEAGNAGKLEFVWNLKTETKKRQEAAQALKWRRPGRVVSRAALGRGC